MHWRWRKLTPNWENWTLKAASLGAGNNLPGEYVLSSSFGIQAAVSLHLVNQIRPDIPVILTLIRVTCSRANLPLY
ncbi:hypothetical protein ACLB1O_01705 [Escherichia coli]